ncbi:hypothetical protein [Emticicia sp. W12TSBA100-4]|uniref:hypothetical protein n=1 Tax=Emticicia sp. W12TSBA100-4 TaxID=3160965 RepID=UPI003305718A
MSGINNDVVVHTELDAYMNSIGFECGEEVIDKTVNFYHASRDIGKLDSVNTHTLIIQVEFITKELGVEIHAFGGKAKIPVIEGFYFDSIDDIKKQIERNDFLLKLLKC